VLSADSPFFVPPWSDDELPSCPPVVEVPDDAPTPVSDEYYLDEEPSRPRLDEAVEADSFQLESRGTTPHRRQRELWRPELHHKSTVATKLAAAGLYDEASIIGACHTRLSIAECYSCGKTRSFLNRCDRFYCPACQPRLANDRRESIEWWAKEVAQPKHVVLTTRNTDTITKEHVAAIRSAFTRLRRMKATAGWRGGFYSLEVTNEGRGWHLHIHALVDCRWIDARELSLMWDKATRGHGCIVKVKDCRSKAYLQEVTKYAVKGTELAKWSAADVAAFVTAFTGVRTFGVFGVLHGLRTKWREWLDSLHESGQACECGCVDWRIQSEGEYEYRHIVIGNAQPDPPRCAPATHPELAFRRG
jgi:hypothetical protein